MFSLLINSCVSLWVFLPQSTSEGEAQDTHFGCCSFVSYFVFWRELLLIPNSTLSETVHQHNHVFGGPNHDDSVHVDAPTTIATPQTSSTICWQRLWLIVLDISHGLARYITSNYWLDKKGGRCYTYCKNSAVWQWRSGFRLGVPYISKWPQTHGLNDCALCRVCLL
jgi:hypothetical protein